jgi:hypothetical protein
VARSSFASGFAGFLIGVVTGLGIAAGAAVFITNSPIPFVEKVQKVTADVDPSQKLEGSIDPNSRLNEQQDTVAATDVDIKTVTTSSETPSEKKVTSTADNGRYWLQVGAYQTREAAEERQLALAMNAIGDAHISEANKLWRVRIGPFASREEALQAQNDAKQKGVKTTLMK